MTESAAGLDGQKNESGCFNCGSQDHFAYACPEPTRKEPYGARFVRPRQAEKNTNGGTARGFDNSKSKSGLVVTRYAPPPPQYPPPTNAWGPGGPYPPPAPAPVPPPSSYGQPPPMPYASSTQIPPPYPPPYPPPPGGYRPPVPPPPPPGAAYSQYGQAPYQPPPPPSSYGPPASYPPPGPYPPPYQQPNPPYPGAPPVGYQGPPPPALHPPSYGAGGYGAAAPPVPPPPPGSYLPAYFPPASHAPGYDAVPPPPNHYPAPPDPAWQPPPIGHGGQRHRDRRDKRNDRDRGHKGRNHRRDNDNNQRGRGQRHEPPVPRPQSHSHSRSHTPKPSNPTKSEKDEASKTESPAAAQEETTSKDDDPDEQFAWDLEKSFLELEFKPADPVGKPLAAEWNDHPTIPPAYNAKCIKSAFYDPDNPDAFLASVRDTKYWTDLKRDPVFRYRRGMVTVQFSGSHHEYFTYHCSRKIGADRFKEREVVPTPSDASLDDAFKNRSAQHLRSSHRQGDAPLHSNGKRGLRDPDEDWRDAKRVKPCTGREHSPPGYNRPRSSRDNDFQGEKWTLQARETRVDSPQRPRSRDEYSRSPGGYRLQGSGERSSTYSSSQRNDMGQHNAHSVEKSRSQREDKSHGHHASPPPLVRSREHATGHDRDRDRDRGRDGDREKHGRDRNRNRDRSRSHSRRRSKSRSVTLPAHSDDESDMSELEWDLLGLERPKRKVAPPPRPVMKKRPRVKVNDAFSRRW